MLFLLIWRYFVDALHSLVIQYYFPPTVKVIFLFKTLASRIDASKSLLKVGSKDKCWVKQGKNEQEFRVFCVRFQPSHRLLRFATWDSICKTMNNDKMYSKKKSFRAQACAEPKTKKLGAISAKKHSRISAIHVRSFITTLKNWARCFLIMFHGQKVPNHFFSSKMV